jgi:hypothetical protein
MSLTLHSKVSLDGSGFAAGLKQIEHSVKETAAALKESAIEAFGATAILELTKHTIELGEQIVDTSRRLGIGIEEMQELQMAAKLTGASVDDLTAFLEKLAVAKDKALSEGDSKMLAAYKFFGIEPDRLKSMNNADQMRAISRVAETTPAQSMIGPLRELGGRGAGALIPLLIENFDEMTAKMRDMHAIMSQSDALGLKNMGDEMKLVAQIILVRLAPAINVLGISLGYMVNTVKANAGFWTRFATKPGLWADIKDQLIGEGKRNFFKGEGNLAKRFSDAGAESLNEKDYLDKAWEQFLLKLNERQAIIDKMNRMPILPDPKAEPEKMFQGTHFHHPETDALLRVGNFLGANTATIQNIAVAQRQLSVLQQIEHNTRNAPSGIFGGFDATFLPYA